MLRLATSIAILASVSMRAQSTTPPQVRLPDVLPQTVRTTQIVLAPDGHQAPQIHPRNNTNRSEEFETFLQPRRQDG